MAWSAAIEPRDRPLSVLKREPTYESPTPYGGVDKSSCEADIPRQVTTEFGLSRYFRDFFTSESKTEETTWQSGLHT